MVTIATRSVLYTYPTDPCGSTKASWGQAISFLVDIGSVQSRHHSLPWTLSCELLQNRIPVQPSTPVLGGGVYPT